MAKCPRCGSTDTDKGKMFPVGVLWDVRFKSDSEPTLGIKKEVRAIACRSCGHIELFVDNSEPSTNGLQSDQCLACGEAIPENASKCPSCGWTFTTCEE